MCPTCASSTSPSLPAGHQPLRGEGHRRSTQPIFLYAEIESYRANLSQERLEASYPVKTMLERGVPLCFSTDAPATSWAVPSDPFPS